jgi:hypothetical protein
VPRDVHAPLLRSRIDAKYQRQSPCPNRLCRTSWWKTDPVALRQAEAGRRCPPAKLLCHCEACSHNIRILTKFVGVRRVAPDVSVVLFDSFRVTWPHNAQTLEVLCAERQPISAHNAYASFGAFLLPGGRPRLFVVVACVAATIHAGGRPVSSDGRSPFAQGS